MKTFQQGFVDYLRAKGFTREQIADELVHNGMVPPDVKWESDRLMFKMRMGREYKPSDWVKPTWYDTRPASWYRLFERREEAKARVGKKRKPTVRMWR